MAVVTHTYTKVALSLATKLMNLTTDALKVMLLSAYTNPTISEDADQFVSDLIARGITETSGTGYTAGGQLLTSVTLVESGHAYTLSCANPIWLTATFNAAYAVFYDSTPGSNSTNPLISFWDLGGVQSPAAVNFDLILPVGGLFSFVGS